MGKKKPHKKAGSQRAPAAHRAGTGSRAEEDNDQEDFENCSVEFQQEQQRLLEEFGAAAAARGQASRGEEELPGIAGDTSAEHWAEVSDVVIEKQQHLLEEAAADTSASTTNGTTAPARTTANGAADSSGADGGRACASSTSGGEVFTVRRVPFRGRRVPVLLQNRNGPCALLAVANGLLLRGTLALDDDETTLSSEQLVMRLTRLCEALNAKGIREDANMRETVSQVVASLPRLFEGLFLNCRFGGCEDFEYTAELGLFDMFGLRVCHAWVAPEVAEVANSWNALSERLALCAELRDELEHEGRPPRPEEDEALAHGLFLENWLEENGGQATALGLRELVAAVREREVCVLFRNNHFSTVYKPRQEALCALLTDEAFDGLASAVWESVELDPGMGDILNADFEAAPAGELQSRPESRSRTVKTTAQAEMLCVVEELGFSREQAEAGLAAVGWSSTQAAVEAILEAPNQMPKVKASNLQPSRARARQPCPSTRPSAEPVCPTCNKRLNSRIGLLSHRVSKGH